MDKEVEAQHFPKTIQWKWCWSSVKRRKGSTEDRKQMMARPSVFFPDPQKMDSISYMCRLINWAHGFLMAETATHVPCGSVISPLLPPFLVYQEPLVGGTWSCSLWSGQVLSSSKPSNIPAWTTSQMCFPCVKWDLYRWRTRLRFSRHPEY